MGSYLTRRCLLLVPTVLGVVTLVFFFIHMIPGDPVEVMLGETAPAADKEALRHSMGLDVPLWSQYSRFLAGAFTGDLGSSYFYRKPVVRVLAERVGATVRLSMASMAVALLIALPLGIASAVKQYSAFDTGSMFFALLGVSMPNFWLGPLLIILFSIHLGWFPVSGAEGLGAIVLPAITLGTALAAVLSRMTRSSMLEVLSADYITTARAKGLPERTVILKHALRNALIPIITVIGLQFGALLSGAIITENVFAWPGIGTLFIQAIQARDYPVVQGCVLLIALSYVVVNLLTDIAYAAVDPRIRYE